MSEMTAPLSPDREWSISNADVTWGARLLVFYAVVVLIQGIHVVEHIIQLVQVYLLGVPDERALGLLGFVFAIQRTEEWLHLAFNSAYLGGLAVIAVGLLRWRIARAAIPGALMIAFLFFGVWLEGWHVLEHLVIISHVVANNGCPCPGILDSQTGLSDTVLHFGYNAIAYAATALPFFCIIRLRRRMG